jgi:hypothetical protein
MALHPQVQAEYRQWILNCVADPFTHIPMFCDWLAEHGIRNQQWREIRALLPNIKYYANDTGKFFAYCRMVSKHKCLSIVFSLFSGKIELRITKRHHYQTNANLQKSYKSV